MQLGQRVVKESVTSSAAPEGEQDGGEFGASLGCIAKIMSQNEISK